MAQPINIPAAEQEALFRRMILIRKAEERLARDFKTGDLPGSVHLYIGQEAVAVGLCSHLDDSDWITSTHRGHGHYLAKGGDPFSMFAEVRGRSSGICGGMGGSMHVADMSKGIIGANGIVGGGIGLAVGAALAAQLDGKGAVAVAFYGDGASAQGVVSEALNIAALWKLPLILLCENNGYSEFSPTETVIAGNISDRGAAYGVPSVAIDGNDIVAVWQASQEAVDRARRGQGPTLIEARTYRFHGHVEGEEGFLKTIYRTTEEVTERRQGDPLLRFATDLVQRGVLSEEQIGSITDDIGAMIERVANRAMDEPWPEVTSLDRLEVR
ncbi:MAG: thiamine pyrophosphate-dependent dehydrogenase E1 component subunit alpha [Pseudomonadota bacterium]